MTSRVLAAVLVIVICAGLYQLRARTMAREHAISVAGAALVGESTVEAKRLPTHELPTIASSLFNACRLQAQAGLEQPVEQLAANRFRAVLAPAPNETDRKQLAGCLSDIVLAHTSSGDVEMYERDYDQI